MKKKSHVFRGIAGIFLALVVIVQLIAGVANNWASKVNELLGVSASGIERSDDPADYAYLSDFENASDLIQAQIVLNTRLAAEGSVVLKGIPTLGGTKVTLFGMRSGEKMQFGGSMGELTDASNVVTLADAMTANGFDVNPDMVQFYKDMAGTYAPTRASGGNVVSSYDDQGAEINEVPIGEYSASLIGSYTDAAVVVFGRDAGESSCFYPGLNGLANPSEFSGSPTGNILSLSNDERALLTWVKSQGFSKIVVLLNSSTSMEIEELKTDDAIHSIIWIGNPGAYGTYGIAKLLSGEILPSGHLPDTFAVNSAKSPAAQNYGIYTFANAADIETTTNNALRSSWYLVEAEGIYTGYKYYETRYFDSVLGQGNASMAAHNETANGSNTWSYDNEVSYSFGYGVEGSTFSEEITGATIDWSGATDSTVTVRVTNTGSEAAKHVVQLYVSVPYTDYDRGLGVEKSAIQLIGYAKTGEAQEQTYADVVLLAPGASEEVTITFNAQDFYSYDRTYAHDSVDGAYVLEEGDYYFATGNGAHDAVQAVLKEMRPDIAGSLQSTGTVYSERLSSTTYLTESNGVTIQNQLAEGDLNSWNTGTGVTYLTRNDWAGTFPQSINSITANDEMIRYLRNAIYDASEALANYDGPTEFTYGADNGLTVADLVGLDYDDPKYDLLLDEMSLQDLVNQYIAYVEELPGIAFPKDFCADSPLGMIATIGQRTKGIYEVSQDDPAYGYHTNTYVSAPVVAATFSPFLQEEEGRLLGNDALWTGYSTWFGPGLNLHRTPYNGRNVAYYSEDAVLTGLTATYVHRALNKYGVVTNAKHFAFNDQETNRDGIAVFLSEQAARENELRGFQIPVRDGSLKGIMSAFNRIGPTHVAASSGLMNGILRGEWGFNGFLITDSVKAAQYFLPRETMLAGNDMVLGGSNNGAAWGFSPDTVKDDPVIQAGLRESFHRKLYFYANSVLMNGITPESSARGAVIWWVVMFQILGGIAFVGFVIFFVLFIVKALKESKQKGIGLELTTGIVALILAAVGTVLFCMSYTTGYYIFGEMQSGVIAVLLGTAIVAEIVTLTLRAMLPDKFWPKLISFVVIGCLAAAAVLILGDRVEGIGNCIVTDYDSGHGGEEAIYMSLAGAILMLIAVIYNIIGSFSRGKDSEEEKQPSVKMAVVRNVGFGVSAVVVLLAVLIPTYNLVNPAGSGGPGSSGSSGSYTISFNQANGNAETMPSYQFLCSDLSGMVRADSRMYIDVTLTLDGEGGYTLVSDSYVIESGKRAEVGDETGLGMILTTNAEGTYVDNGDGTVTTSVPTHAVFEMQTDTYSSQMKGAAQMNVNGNDADGVYDSNDEPAVLDFVPETIWTLSDGAILTYRNANAGGTYTVSFNQANGNAETMPDYQFLCSDLSGMVRADSRMYIDVTLTLDGSGNYTLFVDSYVIESGKRAEVGDETGLGMVLTMNAAGTYTENADGTYATSVPAHAVFEMETDTYSSQMKGAAQMNVNGNDADGVYDSNDEPAVLDFVPETIWTVDGSSIVTWEQVGGGEEEPAGDSLVITSDDGATTFTFYADGSYVFAFADYGVEDPGTYTYDGATLVITDKNGTETTAEGDPLKFHYVFSDSDQLTGDFTVSAADLAALLSGGGSEGGLTVASDDGGTTMTFNANGTYVFAMPSMPGVEESGTYTYDGTTLTVINGNGTEVTATGDPLQFHYVSAMSDQLVGDFTVNAADLSALLSGGGASGNGLVVTSDDGATTMTFNADGTYVFAFDAYGIEDPGTYTYDGTTLTVINSAGVEMTAEGDPLKLHYVSGVSDQLTGDFTMSAAELAAVSGGAASLVVNSADGGTVITFEADGTYVFAFPAYGVEDAGTYTYENGTLTVTNSAGAAVTADGDSLTFTYVSAVSDQLVGEFTVPATAVAALLDGGSGVTVVSDDGGTTFTFNADGTYVFAFAAYGIEDLGTYTCDGTTLTVTNSAGAAVTANGDTLTFHYVSGVSDQLTGDFTVPVSALR